MENYGQKYSHKLIKSVTTSTSRRNRWINSIQHKVKKSDFSPSLYSKPLREYEKPHYKTGDRVRNSKYDSPFRKGWNPQFTQKVSEIVLNSSSKKRARARARAHAHTHTHTHTQTINRMRLCIVNFMWNCCSKSFKKGMIYNRLGF